MAGKLIIFSAPSGSGKSTIINYLMRQGLGLAFSISATSRAPRGTEQHGVEYFFLRHRDLSLLVLKVDCLSNNVVVTNVMIHL